MEHVYDIVIIGGGPAGYSAALYATRAGFDTLIIEKMSVGGQMTLTGDIDNYPGFDEGVDGFTLGMKMQNGAHRFGAVTKYADVTAVELDGKVKRVIISSGEEIFGKVVIIATGANPRKLGIDGEDALVGRGVHYCAHCDGRFYKDKTVVVVGGGNSAVGDAIYLSRIAKKVILVHRRDTLKASRIYHSQLQNSPNVEIMWNSAIDAFSVDGRVVGVKVTNLLDNSISDVECNGVFVSIGRTPVTEFLGGALTLDRAGYIVADESTKTNIDGVFAAGDVRTKALRQVVTAAADGAVAVHFADEYLSLE